MNQIKLDFSRSILDWSDYYPKSRGDCFDYGIMSGCDIGCPALWDGKCDVIGENLDKLDMDEEQRQALLKIYNL